MYSIKFCISALLDSTSIYNSNMDIAIEITDDTDITDDKKNNDWVPFVIIVSVVGVLILLGGIVCLAVSPQ